MEKYDVIIVGAGASGLISALRLIDKNLSVCLIEANDRIGKKILSTGNGKCNILNSNLQVNKYNNDFLTYAISKYDHQYLKSIYENMGIILKEDSEGREYPYSESANTVLNLFRKALENKVKIFTNSKVEKIVKKNEEFLVKTQNFELKSNYLIFATGTKAGFGINSHDIIANFGHNRTKLNQALVPIRIEPIKGVSGVRSKVEASLYIKGNLVFKEKGEVLFKDRALSGILAFKISTYIARYLCLHDRIDCKIYLDFAPEYTEEKLQEIANKNSLEGMVHKSIYMLIKDNVKLLKRFEIKYLGLMGADQAQVISGGIITEEISNKTCQSKFDDNLFIVGEVLDIDGECGGYNLAAAMYTALLATDCILDNANKA